MKHLDLFSGIGGFALACQWAGIETIGFVEIDKYCQKVLRKHWPGVPIIEDIRDVEKIEEIVANATGGRFQQCEVRGEKANDSCQVDKNTRGGAIRANSPAILVTAGFPCQPFSVAGKRQGERDNRYLWPETLAVIKAIKPKWVLLENVTGIKSVYQPDMLSELEGREYLTEEEATADFDGILEREARNTLWLVLEGLRGAGYEVEVLVIPACAVNAWHRRDRVWIVAHSNGNGKGERYRSDTIGKDFAEVCQWRDCQSAENQKPNIGKGCQNVAYANGNGFGRYTETKKIQSKRGAETTALPSGEDVADTTSDNRWPIKEPKQSQGNTGGQTIRDSSWWAVEPRLGKLVNGIPPFVDGYFNTEPDIPRVATGVKNRVDRLKCLGNAIVPAVAFQIIKIIKEVDSEWQY